MIRRARLSFKPNVRLSGRVSGQGVSSGRDGEVVPPAEPVPNPGRDDKAADSGESIITAPVTGDPVDPQPQGASKEEPFEKTSAVNNETPPSQITSTPLQRRKRISTLPNLAKPRVSSSASAAVTPLKPSPVDIPSPQPASIAPCKNDGPPPEKGKVLSPQRSQVPLTPPQVQHVTLPEKRTPVPQVPQFSPYKKSVLKPQEVSPAKPVEFTQKEDFIPLKERPSQKSCSNEPFELDKKRTPKKIINSNLEKERLRRAQKLRDLLKEQLQKERRSWREKRPIINSMEEPERSKMTMRDFIHFIPMSNPMSSSLEENKSSEKSFVEPQTTGLGGKNSAEEDEPDDDDAEEDESQLLAPRVKVAEDGSIILDEESLTVEVCRNKAPIVEGNDPIFERGSTTTYASFRRSSYSKPWSNQETDMFFLAISMVGTDFSMISQLFPHRQRIEIKNKFKKEERMNGWRIDKAFREKKDFDFEFFAQLLEKALEAGKKKKTTKSKQPRKTNAKPRKKQKAKTAAEQSLCDEESVISEEEGADAGTAEKENKRSQGADESSGVSDPVPGKKKRVRRKKDNTKEQEEETHESQDDEFTRKPKKKSRKDKTNGVDVDIQPDPQSVDTDESLKETPSEQKTRAQENKSNYKEPEREENDADLDITDDVEIDDDDLVSCKPGEADLSSQSVAATCAEESSLLLFTEESDYQSGLDLSGMYQNVSEVNEAISQASDVSLVAPNILNDETEPMNVTQDETSSLSFDKFDSLDGALDAGHGQLGEQDLEPENNAQKESSIKPTLPGRGRLQRPKPNLPARTSTRRETLDATDSEDTPMEGTEKCSDLSVSTQKNKDDSGNPNRGDIDVPAIDDKQKEDHSFSVQVSLPAQTDVGSEPDLSQTEGSNSVQQDHDKEDTSKQKSSLPVRGRLKPKPNLTRALAKNKSSDTEQEGPCSQGSAVVSQVSVKLLSHPPGRDQENEAKERTESSSGSQCGKSSLKPAALARGRFQRPKPNLIKSSSRKEASDDCGGRADGDIGRGFQSDSHSEKEENEVVVNTGSEAPLDSCKSDKLHPSSLLPMTQDNVTEASSVPDTQSIKSPIKPAPLARGRFQKAKPNLVRSSGCKGESVAASLIVENRAEGDDLHSSCAGNSTELTKEVPSVEQHCSGKTDSTMPLKVDSVNLSSLKEPCMPPAVSPKCRFQKPKPNLGRAAAKRDVSKEEACVESGSESKDTALNIPVDEAETAQPPEKSHEGRSVVEEDSVTMEKLDNEASSVLSLESTCTMTEKMQAASAEEEKTLKPDLRTGRLQRPRPDISRSTRSVEAAPLVSTVEKEEKTAGTTSTDNSDPNISLDVGVLSDGDAEIKSPTVKNPCDKDFAEALNKPVSKSDTEQSQPVSLKSSRSRFPKPNPNLGRATLRKETSTIQSKTLVQEKGQETLNAIDKNPEKNVDMPDATIAGHSGKEAGHTIEEKTAAIKPATLKRSRLIRPVPNLGKSSAKTLSPIQSKTNEDVNSSPTLKDKVPVVANSSPANIKRKASSYIDSSPKRICLSSTPQKPPCSSDSEVDQVALTSDPQSSGQSGSEQGAASPQCSRFGRPLRKLTSPPPVSSKSDNLSDRPEKEKAAHNIKSSTTKVSKLGPSKSKGKATLVKIRARQQEEDEDEDADLGFEEETYDLTPDTQNQAPVFVPFSLRSPRPVTAEIEETGEELEIPVELPNKNQDLEGTNLHHVVDSEVRQDKKEQCDGSAEAAVTLISMGGSVYKTDIETHSEAVNVSSPHRDMSAMESSFTVDSRMVEDPCCAANLENKTQTDGISSDCHLADNLPNVINDSLTFPVEQISYPIVQGNVLQQDISSQDTSVSGCFLGEHDTGEEATFILTLVEIPINDDYAYSCDSNVAETLPAPVLISSGSSQALTQNLNSGVETVICEPCVVGQDDNDLMLGQTSNRSAQGMDEVDHTPQKKPHVSEQVVDLEIKNTALDTDGDGKATPEVSVTEHKPKEPTRGSQVTAPTVRERPPNWPTAKNTVPVEMPGMSVTESLNRNLPLVYANQVTTSKTTLKRPGKKPLGFLSLVCKDKKSNEETLKNSLPKPKCRKISPTVHARQKKSPNVSLENATDSEVPSSSPVLSPTEEVLPSTSSISELEAIPESQELATEEEAAPVSQYFFSDIFMEVDD